jgi:hypothetical protein
MVRDVIKELSRMGPPPSEQELIRNPSPFLEKYEQLLSSIEKPVTDEEAKVLLGVFGVDGCFGLGWTLLHLIETAPNWSADEILGDSSNEWIQMLKDRAKRWRNAGYAARHFYTEKGLPDPRENRDSKRDERDAD